MTAFLIGRTLGAKVLSADFGSSFLSSHFNVNAYKSRKESKLSKLVLKKYVFRKVPEYEGLIEDFIHFESDDKKKILEILKSKGIIEKSKIPKKEKKLLYKRLKLYI